MFYRNVAEMCLDGRHSEKITEMNPRMHGMAPAPGVYLLLPRGYAGLRSVEIRVSEDVATLCKKDDPSGDEYGTNEGIAVVRRINMMQSALC